MNTVKHSLRFSLWIGLTVFMLVSSIFCLAIENFTLHNAIERARTVVTTSQEELIVTQGALEYSTALNHRQSKDFNHAVNHIRYLEYYIRKMQDNPDDLPAPPDNWSKEPE